MMQNVKNQVFDKYIGIDPDVDQSGFAIWDKKNKSLKLYNHSLSDLFEIIRNESKENSLIIYIEAGWLIKKTNWHRKGFSSNGTLERQASRVGANHEIGKQIEKFCIKHRIEYKLIKPKGKIRAEYFERITGYKGRTNQEARDAGMLIYGI